MRKTLALSVKTVYNMGEMDEKDVLAKNLIKYRKASGLTQIELAEKISYSDKAVSKWERGEGAPDVFVLKSLSEIYQVSIDKLVKENPDKPATTKKTKEVKRSLILILSTLIAWLCATVVYVALSYVFPKGSVPFPLYLAFIWAIPVSAIIGIVFSSIWHKEMLQFLSITVLLWTIALALFLSLNLEWYIFLIDIPLQVLAIFWSLYKRVKKK